MHPFLTNRRWLISYLSVWGLLAAVPIALLAPHSAEAWLQVLALALPLTVLFGLATIPCWYLCRAMPPKWTNVVRLVVAHGIAAAIASLLWSVITEAAANLIGVILDSKVAALLIRDRRAGMVAVGVLFYLLAAVFHYLLISMEAARQAEAQAGALVVHAREAALNALKAQVHPHFLFNSLNAISALATRDAVRAREMCVLLADFLRQSLRVGELREIPLAEELVLVRSYLGVEKIRLGERLTVVEKVAANCERCLVLPLLLQPLVENAVRHGVATIEAGGTVTVEAEAISNLLRLRVANPYEPGPPESPRHGRGLKGVRERLRTAYGGDALVEVSGDDDTYTVSLVMPWRETPYDD